MCSSDLHDHQCRDRVKPRLHRAVSTRVESCIDHVADKLADQFMEFALYCLLIQLSHINCVSAQLMSTRIRKLIGVFALFALVTVWAMLAMAIAQFPAIFSNPLIAGIYYVLAGIGWIVPAMPLIKWMSGRSVRQH